MNQRGIEGDLLTSPWNCVLVGEKLYITDEGNQRIGYLPEIKDRHEQAKMLSNGTKRRGFSSLDDHAFVRQRTPIKLYKGGLQSQNTMPLPALYRTGSKVNGYADSPSKGSSERKSSLLRCDLGARAFSPSIRPKLHPVGTWPLAPVRTPFFTNAKKP